MIDQGLPSNLRSIRLLYNSPSQCFIASTSALQAEGMADELFYRHRGVTRYTRISASKGDVSICNPFSCANAPLVMFNFMSARADIPGAYDWASLSVFDLVSHEVRDVISDATLPIPAGYERGWIASLISVDAEGKTAVVTAGFERLVSGGAVVDYAAFELDCINLKLSKIADLPNIFA